MLFGRKRKTAAGQNRVEKAAESQLVKEEAVPVPDTGKLDKTAEKPAELTAAQKAERLAELTAAAESGDAIDLRTLGHALMTGEFGEQNDEKAFSLLERAAEQNDTEAMILLATRYIRGRGVTRDYAKALALLERAAEHGSAEAYRHLGTHMELGVGMGVHFAKAAECYETAIDLGDNIAKCQLGSLYERGLGVKQDYDRAEMLYRECTEQANLYGAVGWASLGNLFESRTDGRQDLTEARACYQKAADAGHPEGFAGVLRLNPDNPHPWVPGHNFSLSIQFCVSDIYAEPTYERAVHRAMVQENALQDVWRAREAGDTENEIKLLNRVATMRYPPAQAELGRMLYEGDTLPKKEKSGRKLLMRAMEHGYFLEGYDPALFLPQ